MRGAVAGIRLLHRPCTATATVTVTGEIFEWRKVSTLIRAGVTGLSMVGYFLRGIHELFVFSTFPVPFLWNIWV